jgi:hypothetical protein
MSGTADRRHNDNVARVDRVCEELWGLLEKEAPGVAILAIMQAAARQLVNTTPPDELRDAFQSCKALLLVSIDTERMHQAIKGTGMQPDDLEPLFPDKIPPRNELH